MAYLDMSPVLTALRERPHEFTVSDGWVQQHSSPYRLKAQIDGHVLVETEDGSASPNIMRTGVPPVPCDRELEGELLDPTGSQSHLCASNSSATLMAAYTG